MASGPPSVAAFRRSSQGRGARRGRVHYPHRMHATAVPAPRPRGLKLMFNWGRLRFVGLFSLVWGLLFSTHLKGSNWSIIGRTLFLGLVVMLVFGLFEQWPKRLPRWIARWALQVIAVALVIPPTMAIFYAITTAPGAPPFYKDADRMAGFSMMVGIGLFVAPWVALGAVVRQKEAFARHQALTFDFERSELERQALDARLRLLPGRVRPHCSFTPLANGQARVESGWRQAPAVLEGLIAYVRAAVPRLNEAATTLGHELDLVRVYLD